MSYQSSIRALAQSIVDLCESQEEEVTQERMIPLFDTCEVCGEDYLADHPDDCAVSGLCDECAGRITVQIAVLDEPFDDAEWLDESDIVEVIAA